MGYNLELRCVTCAETAFCFRGHEASGIRLFAGRHSGHDLECGIDNGFAEHPWMDGDSDLCLPDDLLPAGKAAA